MMKFILFTIVMILTAVTIMSMGENRKTGIAGGGSTARPTQISSPSATEAVVSLPTGEDIIRTYVGLINERKISEAIGMMDSTLITSDSVKQQYGVVFNSFSSIIISKIGLEAFGKEDWGPGEERYRVDLMISIKPDGQKGLWDEGVNTRWITVKKQQEDGRFMIHDIATGP